ncbi:leucyl aminopeptidase [Longimicrobium sp.]|uniref:leucyl aminopeptidase n=1 Tax=Longimicrobium sp. TaxID=2029185 RepID=UPI002B9AE39D|nr:leucyl aminopeptidase [Longimicrobium sp.]HSU16614.1 leucyl aminopeptidase [Longimicrobium sp.]
MNVSVLRGELASLETPLLAVPVFEGNGADPAVQALDLALGGLIAAVRERGDLRGKEGESVTLYPAGGSVAAQRVLVIGLGKPDSLTPEKLRRAGGTAARQAARARAASVTFALPASSVDSGDAARAVTEGVVLGSYSFTELKSRADDAPAPVELADLAIAVPAEADEAAVAEGARVGSVVASAENFARNLGNLPGNVVTPTRLAEVAGDISTRFGMKLTVLGPREMEAEGMGALLAVARGTDEEPRLIVLEHRGGADGDRPLVLVGKGLTFDAGGISIKPAAGMEEMKFDMCGGAAVLGAMHAIGELGVKANVVGIVPSSENLLGGKAMKPGDIFRAASGKTIEVVNTDAEGRLILADALHYAKRFDPVAMLDAATLTGACVIALGHQASGIMGNDEALLDEVKRAGDRTGERCWPLPMFDEYRDQIKSDYADIKNSGGRPAGTITAAWFLREFVGDTPWVHLDVAGTAYGDGKLAYLSKGSTGAPTRLFVEWVLSRAG